MLWKGAAPGQPSIHFAVKKQTQNKITFLLRILHSSPHFILCPEPPLHSTSWAKQITHKLHLTRAKSTTVLRAIKRLPPSLPKAFLPYEPQNSLSSERIFLKSFKGFENIAQVISFLWRLKCRKGEASKTTQLGSHTPTYSSQSSFLFVHLRGLPSISHQPAPLPLSRHLDSTGQSKSHPSNPTIQRFIKGRQWTLWHQSAALALATWTRILTPATPNSTPTGTMTYRCANFWQ